ncbi:MAG: gluconate 2-dehydrogenase subunit 3 family protein [Gaiellaceae bacterium]
MVGRYPDFDVLEGQDHWDEPTRRLVLDRLENVPERRFFNVREAATVRALCEHLTGQVGEEPKIPVLEYLDEKLFEGALDGYRYFDMPDDCETWRVVARGLDEEARKLGAESFSLLSDHDQNELCHRFSRGELFGGAWACLNVSRAFSVVVRHVCAQFYSHPWAWNEIGFGGPAYPRGYSRFGSPHLRDGETEAWEAKEAFELDPVKDVRARELD